MADLYTIPEAPTPPLNWGTWDYVTARGDGWVETEIELDGEKYITLIPLNTPFSTDRMVAHIDLNRDQKIYSFSNDSHNFDWKQKLCPQCCTAVTHLKTHGVCELCHNAIKYTKDHWYTMAQKEEEEESRKKRIKTE